jgi:predicted nucleotidyltransferase
VELKKRLSENVPIPDLRVFGSRARGDSDEYSDMEKLWQVLPICYAEYPNTRIFCLAIR